MHPKSDQITSEYLVDGRARRLARAVDNAYWQFVRNLPDRLQEIARKKGTFDHRSGSSNIAGLQERNVINTGAYFLFWELCDGIEDQSLLNLAEANAYIGLAYILLDHLVDEQAEDPGQTALMQLSYHEQGIRVLQTLFPADNPFWNEFDRLSGQLRSSLALELTCREDPSLYSEENFRLSAQGKVSPAVITLTAATMLLRGYDSMTDIEKALNFTISAGQLAHDVFEWRKDLAEGDLTYFLFNCAAVDRWKAAEWPSEAEIEQEINSSNLEFKFFVQARDWFVEAKELSQRFRSAEGENIEFVNWNSYLNRYIFQAAADAVRTNRGQAMELIFSS